MRIALAAAVVALSAGLMLLACGGAVAPTEAPEAEPASATGEPGDAGRDAGCAAATVEAWCAMVARGGVGVDPRADACCTRWIDDALRDE